MAGRELRLLKGVGPARSEAFARMGILTRRQLLSLYPREYEDRTDIKPLAALGGDAPQAFVATILDPVTVTNPRPGLTLYRTQAGDETGRIRLAFFNQSFVKTTLSPGRRFLFFGKVNRTTYGLDAASPEFSPLAKGEIPQGAITPIYPLTEGLSRKTVSNAIAAAFDAEKDRLRDNLPPSLREEHDLMPLADALWQMHKPESFALLAQAKRRLVFEELFFLALGLFSLKNGRTAQKGARLALSPWAEFFNALPFSLTGAQLRAINEAMADMQSGKLMNRLVQGDVGSGKTMVAAAVAFQTAKNGRQTAIMAPTEILAAQHMKTLTPLLQKLGMEAALLTGRLPAAQKRAAKEAIAAGKAAVVIGTQALLSEDVHFANLGLVVCDEQHRFGVAERASLAGKAEDGAPPHVLVMSATPIPRTLALFFYGDLDLSVVDELPPGRKPVETFLVGEEMRPRIDAFVRKHAAKGPQTYIVCPLVDESDDGELKAASAFAENLKNTVFADLSVDVLHGRMKPAEKEAVMQAFQAGKTDVLVATTVIEVGIDNPNAALMVIENAERFGLSQLHQLRGRVGRGAAKSYCVLYCQSENELTRKRLEVLAQTEDGFAIAEQDLALRGPGDFFGRRQHGLPALKLASLAADMDVLQEAQTAAAALLAKDPTLADPENAPLAKQVAALFAEAEKFLN